MKISPPVPGWATDALSHLRRVDPIMARIIQRSGPFEMTRRPENFQALVRAIIFQQLAGNAALAIFNRFVATLGGRRFPTPDQVIAASDETLRQVGLSRGKMAYIRDLALKVRDGAIKFRRFPKMSDEEIIAELTQVRGIGRWTAEMFLMFNLHRPDVLAVGDLGLRSAATREYTTGSPVTEKVLLELGEIWRPYRTAAAWYLWQSSRTVTLEATEVAETKARTIKTKIVARPTKPIKSGTAKPRARLARSRTTPVAPKRKRRTTESA